MELTLTRILEVGVAGRVVQLVVLGSEALLMPVSIQGLRVVRVLVHRALSWEEK